MGKAHTSGKPSPPRPRRPLLSPILGPRRPLPPPLAAPPLGPGHPPPETSRHSWTGSCFREPHTLATPSPIHFGGNRPLQPGSPSSQACCNRGESPPEGTLPGPCQPMVFQCAFRSGGQVGHPMGHSLIRVSIPLSDGRSPSVDTVSSRQAREASCPPPCWPPALPGARLAWGGVPTKEGNPSLWGSWGHRWAPSAA